MGYVDSHTHLWFSETIVGVQDRVYSEMPLLKGIKVEEIIRLFDSINMDYAVIMGYPTRIVWGLDEEFVLRVIESVKSYGDRFAVLGGVDIRFLSLSETKATLEKQYERGVSGLKLHPPHMWVKPNQYREEEGGLKQLEALYEFAQDHSLPVVIHTGTSAFKNARNKYGDPIYVDDVAVDFPRLKIILAHMGRTMWFQTAFQLVRIRPNIYGEISGIPPKRLLEYIPRIEEISDKTLYGSDFGSPGSKPIDVNLKDFLSLPISEVAKNAMADNVPKSLIKPLER